MSKQKLLHAALVLLLVPATAYAQRGSTPVRTATSVGSPRAPHATVDPARLARPDLAFGTAPRPAILLTGYWPPSNEAVRQFSTNPLQNPGGWQGSDWEGRGYDVYSFFPEFSPPTCTSCGKGTGDLEVDYQDTSADFWPIADGLKPIVVMTFSRTSASFSWELEMNTHNHSSWISDYVAPTKPTPTPPDAGWPADGIRTSTLPVDDIVADVAAAGLGLNPFVCFAGDSGGFLSEFIGYHGSWYQGLHSFPTDPAWCVAAGHTHVGSGIAWPVAEDAVEVSLRSVIEYVDAVVATTICQPDLGFGGPGAGLLEVCGQPLTLGATEDLRVTGAPASQPGFLLAGFTASQTPVLGGTLVPFPPVAVIPVTTDASGAFRIDDVTGNGNPATVYVQALIADPAQPQGATLTNAVAVALLP